MHAMEHFMHAMEHLLHAMEHLMHGMEQPMHGTEHLRRPLSPRVWSSRHQRGRQRAFGRRGGTPHARSL